MVEVKEIQGNASTSVYSLAVDVLQPAWCACSGPGDALGGAMQLSSLWRMQCRLCSPPSLGSSGNEEAQVACSESAALAC